MRELKGSIFETRAIRRGVCKWEDYLFKPTPVQRLQGRWFKREDWFAPVGYGGINGSKCRQLVHLLNDYVRNSPGMGLLTGASVLSPQVSMAATIAKHYDLPCEILLGGTKPETAGKHENVAIAKMAGARFTYTNVGYNPALQRSVLNRAEESDCAGYFRLCYGITTHESASDQEVERFHAVGAAQTSNLPDEVEHIIMPAGSCNSCTSVLYGIATRKPKQLKRITLIGIGPTRLLWIDERLKAIERASKLSLRGAYRPNLRDHRNLEGKVFGDGDIEIRHFDLHAAGRYTYQDKVAADLHGIEFHPTYEAKCIRFMREHPLWFEDFWAGSGSALFWIVGSKPSYDVMREALAHA